MIGLKNVGLKKQCTKRDCCCTSKWGEKTTSTNSAHKGQKKKWKVHDDGQKYEELTMEKEINSAQRRKEKETNSAQLEIKRSSAHDVYFV